MNGTIDNIKRKYQAIKDRYVVLNKLDELGRPIYTYTNLLKKLSDEFYLAERTIAEILLLDLDKWVEKERKGTNKQKGLFDEQ